MQPLFALCLSFFIYSFLGWVCETLYCSAGQRQLVNRGFLRGPLCPVYGFGALAVLYLLAPFARWPVLLYALAMLVTSTLEYLTGLLLEKLFHTRWWDYSSYRFNLHGRVCLKNSLLFGLIALIMVLFIDPAVQRGLSRLSAPISAAFSLLLLAMLAADTVQSARSALALGQAAEQLAALRAELREKEENLREALEQAVAPYREKLESPWKAIDERLSLPSFFEGNEERRAAIREFLAALPLSDALQEKQDKLKARVNEAHDRLEQLHQRYVKLTDAAAAHRRLLLAFPGMRSLRHEEILEELREGLHEALKKRKECHGKNK